MNIMSSRVASGSNLVQKIYEVTSSENSDSDCNEDYEDESSSVAPPTTTSSLSDNSTISRPRSGRSTALYNKFVQYGKARVQPGLLYFQSKFSNELSSSLAAFKAARLFVPSKVQEMKPDVTNINSLKSFTYVKHEHNFEHNRSNL